MTDASKGGRRGKGVALVLVCALLGLLLASMDARDAAQVLHQAHWFYVPVAVLCTALSYGCLSGGYAAIHRVFGIRVPRRDLLEIGFISFALNNLLSIGGTAGYSLRLVLLRRRGLAAGDVLAASLVHSYLNHIVMMSLLPLGLLYLLLRHPLGQRQTESLTAASVLALLLLAGSTVLLGHRAARAKAARFLGAASRRLLRRDVEPVLRHLDATLGVGMDAIRARPRLLVLPILLVLGDWATSVLALDFCFRALGEALHPGVLLTGFALGVTLGFLSMLPGGMGVQEGSMVGTYALLGVDYERAVLASMLFRVLYYLLPFAVSLLLYVRLLRGGIRSSPIPSPPAQEL